MLKPSSTVAPPLVQYVCNATRLHCWLSAAAAAAAAGLGAMPAA